MTQFFLYGLIGLLVVFTLRTLNRKAEQPAKKQADGRYLLRVSRVYAVIGYSGILIGSAFLILLLLEDAFSPEGKGLVILGSLLFLGLGIYLLLWQTNQKVLVDAQGIEAGNWRNQTQSLVWANIRQVRYNKLTGTLMLLEESGKKLKLSQYLVGLCTLLYLMEQNTEFRTRALGIPLQPKAGRE